MLSQLLLLVPLLGWAAYSFVIGYLPLPADSLGTATPADQWDPALPVADAAAPPPKLVFMLVDALRDDFVFGPRSQMHYTNRQVMGFCIECGMKWK